MRQKEMLEQRHRILNRVKDSFDEEMIPAQIERPDVSDPADEHERLMILMEDIAAVGVDAMGEFFFLPSQQSDEYQVFMNLITIDEEINLGRLNELLLAINILNNYIPVGAFGIDLARNNIVYRHNCEMPIRSSDAPIKDKVDLSMGLSVALVKEFAYMLLEVNDEIRNADSIEKYFNA